MSKVVHFEIPVDDAERASAFYRSAFGWEISGYAGMPYWLVTAGPGDEPGADGALIQRGDIHRTPVVIIGVDDVDAALARVVEHGGRVLQERMAVPGTGWSAYVVDPEGNTVGIFQPDGAAG